MILCLNSLNSTLMWHLSSIFCLTLSANCLTLLAVAFGHAGGVYMTKPENSPIPLSLKKRTKLSVTG